MTLAVLVFGLVRAAVWGTWQPVSQSGSLTVAVKLISRCIYYLCALPGRTLKRFSLSAFPPSKS